MTSEDEAGSDKVIWSTSCVKQKRRSWITSHRTRVTGEAGWVLTWSSRNALRSPEDSCVGSSIWCCGKPSKLSAGTPKEVVS